jgi:hypothetical protein
MVTVPGALPVKPSLRRVAPSRSADHSLIAANERAPASTALTTTTSIASVRVPHPACGPWIGHPAQRGRQRILMTVREIDRSDGSLHPASHLELVAAELNTRPRKTLGWDTPAARLATLIPT